MYQLFHTFLLTQLAVTLKLPYPINGPKSYNDRIAIVGAGPAGIHMALSLKQRGFTNVIVLEKSNRIGGKSLTINSAGTVHDMGTVYLSPDYMDNVIPLVHKYMPNNLVYLQPPSVWLDNLPQPISYQNYLLRYSMAYFKTNVPNKAVEGMLDAVSKYIKIHNRLFGKYEGEIMPEPKPKVWHEIRGTYLDFLKRNQLEAILPLLYASNTVQGYGRIDEIACLYGLMWNTPTLLNGIKQRLAGKTNDTGLYMLKNGFQNLWEEIAKQENIKVVKNVRIYHIYRKIKSNNNDTIWMHYKVGNQRQCKTHYNFLIWSPEMKTSLKYWKNPEFCEERFYFRKPEVTYFTTALATSQGTTKGTSPIDYFLDNINKRHENRLWAQRDSFAALQGYTGEDYQNNKLPSGNKYNSVRTTVAYQMNDVYIAHSRLNHNLFKSLRNIGGRNIKLTCLNTWRYFPRYTPDDMVKGYLWRVLEMQGKYGMWYIGSSVSFESVKSVIEYNKILLKNMKIPERSDFSSNLNYHKRKVC